jgi:3-dehydroquinate synthetase
VAHSLPPRMHNDAFAALGLDWSYVACEVERDDLEAALSRLAALGLLAALRLSGLPTDVVETVLDPRPVSVDCERAWEALQRDKKVRDGRIRLVLLDAPGKPVWGVERPEAEVRSALDELIAG